MTLMNAPTRSLTILFGVALSLLHTSQPTLRQTPHTLLAGLKPAHLPALMTIAFVALAPQTANAYALPEVFNPLKYTNTQLDRRHTSTTVECTDTESITATVAGTNIPQQVTVTITVGLPSSAPYGSGSTNGTIAYGSSGTQTSTSSTRTSTSTSTISPPVSTVDPLLASAQEAQRLNLAFRFLRTGDACTAGERACINNQVAQCSTPSSSSASDTNRWVTQNCVIIGSDPNQTPVCAAVPYTSASTTSSSKTALTSPYRASNSTNSTISSPPVSFGCFLPSDLTKRFTNAGVTGGALPPGTRANAAAARMKRAFGRVGMGVVLALIAGMIL